MSWCHISAACFPQCENNGVCVRPGECKCRPNYKGELCEIGNIDSTVFRNCEITNQFYINGDLVSKVVEFKCTCNMQNICKNKSMFICKFSY